MNLKPLVSLVAAHGKATAILLAVTVASAGFVGWLHEHDQRVADAALAQGKIAAANTALARAKADSAAAAKALTIALAGQQHAESLLAVSTAHVRTALPQLAQTVAQLPAAPATRADTNSIFAALPQIRQQSAATIAACTDLVQSCQAYRDSTRKLLIANDLAIAARDSTINAMIARDRAVAQLTHAERASRWSLGVSGGYGAVHDASGWHAGPGVLAAVQLRIF